MIMEIKSVKVFNLNLQTARTPNDGQSPLQVVAGILADLSLAQLSGAGEPSQLEIAQQGKVHEFFILIGPEAFKHHTTCPGLTNKSWTDQVKSVQEGSNSGLARKSQSEKWIRSALIKVSMNQPLRQDNFSYARKSVLIRQTADTGLGPRSGRPQGRNRPGCLI